MEIKNIKLSIQKVGTGELFYESSKLEDYLTIFPEELHPESVLKIDGIVYQIEYINIRNTVENSSVSLEFIIEADIVDID